MAEETGVGVGVEVEVKGAEEEEEEEEGVVMGTIQPGGDWATILVPEMEKISERLGIEKVLREKRKKIKKKITFLWEETGVKDALDHGGG